MRNLLQNAVVHGGAGRVAVDIESLNTGTLIRLTFADDGRGVPVEAFEELGQPFARPETTAGIGHGAVRVPPARDAHARRATVRPA